MIVCKNLKNDAAIHNAIFFWVIREKGSLMSVVILNVCGL